MVLYYVVLYYIILYYIILYYIISYYIVLYCIILYDIVLHYAGTCSRRRPTGRSCVSSRSRPCPCSADSERGLTTLYWAGCGIASAIACRRAASAGVLARALVPCARAVGRVNVGRVTYMFLLDKSNVLYVLLLLAVYYACVAFVRRGDLYNFCRARISSAHLTVEARCVSPSWRAEVGPLAVVGPLLIILITINHSNTHSYSYSYSYSNSNSNAIAGVREKVRWVDKRVPSLSLASSSRPCWSHAVPKRMFPWRARCPLRPISGLRFWISQGLTRAES